MQGNEDAGEPAAWRFKRNQAQFGGRVKLNVFA